ncbi:uncharacterized protein LOC107267287 isoform X2 [Cephus cinctus]|uniref:Uncharacterized protein LOC107267287 isoform X2 n=1 Tax=Cephus cinctus TaxID=211228 RepID=A0AAJ7RGY1_CEPCN|nr:uncharacterized protein LOC107267287 isoform X2 [Cephus cinctus]
MGPCALYFLLVFAACLPYERNRVLANKALKNEQNIGTVLFERSDCGKHCWTSEEFTILNSRRMFQDILPKVKVINCQNDQYIAMLMDYFHICLECVRKLSIGKTKHLMLKALADTMGGYLQVYILPLTKHSYYAGNIKYRNAKRLFELFDELKNFLHTNGVGWMKPTLNKKHVKTPPIVITPPRSSLACNGLITYPAHSAEMNSRDFHYSHAMKRKRFTRGRRPSRNSPLGYSEYGGITRPVIVPLPFLDDEAQPNSIAMPFKTDNLQSLYCEKSAFALVKYYVASVKCIVSKSKTNYELGRFNEDFFEWLQTSVHTHLDDEKWYPAFGGVLRVMASLRETGLVNGLNKGKQGGGYQMMPKLIVVTTKQPDDGVSPLYRGNSAGKLRATEKSIIAVSCFVCFWILMGVFMVCYNYLKKHSEECSPCESPTDSRVAILYGNADYCQAASQKSFTEKFKQWWGGKCGTTCPGACKDYDEEERYMATINYCNKDVIDMCNSNKSCQKSLYTKTESPQLLAVSPTDTDSPRTDDDLDNSYNFQGPRYSRHKGVTCRDNYRQH